MTPQKKPQHIPYSDEIRQLITKKSNTLFRARFKKSEGDFEEARALFEETAQQEEQIARLLEVSGNPLDALISWVSAGSCYMKAEKYQIAQAIFEGTQKKPLLPEALQKELHRLKGQCQTALKKQASKPQKRRRDVSPSRPWGGPKG